MAIMGRVARVCFGLVLVATLANAAMAAPMIIANIELSKPFGTRSPWVFQATQGSDVEGTNGKTSGIVTLCLRNAASKTCDHGLMTKMDNKFDNDPDFGPLYDWPHRMNRADVLYPKGTEHAPLFFVQSASAPSVDGNESVFTQVFAYRRDNDHFQRIYSHLSRGSNNDQDVELIKAGPLQGYIISVDPTENAPFAFWIVVNELTPSDTYREVLRYRSTTRYDDGNMLSVIDSDMPVIQEHLGLWHAGMPLPLPASGCANPKLVHQELWCN